MMLILLYKPYYTQQKTKKGVKQREENNLLLRLFAARHTLCIATMLSSQVHKRSTAPWYSSREWMRVYVCARRYQYHYYITVLFVDKYVYRYSETYFSCFYYLSFCMLIRRRLLLSTMPWIVYKASEDDEYDVAEESE